jgi:hypothetical protein
MARATISASTRRQYRTPSTSMTASVRAGLLTDGRGLNNGKYENHPRIRRRGSRTVAHRVHSLDRVRPDCHCRRGGELHPEHRGRCQSRQLGPCGCGERGEWFVLPSRIELRFDPTKHAHSQDLEPGQLEYRCSKTYPLSSPQSGDCLSAAEDTIYHPVPNALSTSLRVYRIVAGAKKQPKSFGMLKKK